MDNLNSKSGNPVKGTIRVNLPILITTEDIDDIMVGALEGGITYWCDRVEVEGEYLGEYASEQIARGGILKFFIEEPISDDAPEYCTLDYHQLIDGVAKWLDFIEDPKVYGRVIRILPDGTCRLDMGNVDSLSCDSIIQYALFGEEVFA